jgi:hypothetical protein
MNHVRHIFTAANVLSAVYRIAATSVLLYHLVRRKDRPSRATMR